MPSSSDSYATGHRRQRATVVGAVLEGWRRALRAPGVVLAVWIVTTAVTLPLAAILHEAVRSDLGSSTAAERALEGWDLDWTGEFASDADGVAATFSREILGATAIVATAGRILDGELPAPALAGAIAGYLGLWVFLSGGIIDRLARARPLEPATFIALCGRYFFRLVRLAVVSALVYWVVFRTVHPFLFNTVFDWWTRDMASESHALGVLAGLYGAFAILLGLVSVFVDFTRVRLIVEDRRSVLSALGAGIRFVRRRFWRAAGVYGLNMLALIVLARLWIQVAPGAASQDWQVLGLTQVYVVLRIWGKLAFLGSETVFFQGELAHAEYAAAPMPQWPDSVSVEAVRNLRRRG